MCGCKFVGSPRIFEVAKEDEDEYEDDGVGAKRVLLVKSSSSKNVNNEDEMFPQGQKRREKKSVIKSKSRKLVSSGW